MGKSKVIKIQMNKLKKRKNLKVHAKSRGRENMKNKLTTSINPTTKNKIIPSTMISFKTNIIRRDLVKTNTYILLTRMNTSCLKKSKVTLVERVKKLKTTEKIETQKLRGKISTHVWSTPCWKKKQECLKLEWERWEKTKWKTLSWKKKDIKLTWKDIQSKTKQTEGEDNTLNINQKKLSNPSSKNFHNKISTKLTTSSSPSPTNLETKKLPIWEKCKNHMT